MPQPAAGPAATDRNLLFGILAVQMDFVGRDALIAAMHAWVLAKHLALADLLGEARALTPARCSLLEAIADEHVEAHSNPFKKSVAAPNQDGDNPQKKL